MALRMLWLGNSEDIAVGIPEERRSPAVAAAMLRAAAGGDVDLECRRIWPTVDLPARAESWIAKSRPDVVVLRISAFWTVYESVPVKVGRMLGPLGRRIADMGKAAADSPQLGDSMALHLLRRAALRTIGGAPHFAPETVVEIIGETIRTIVRHEDVLLVVRGSEGRTLAEWKRFEPQRAAADAALERLCASLRVPWSGGTRVPGRSDTVARRGRESVHLNADGQERVGRETGTTVVAAWAGERQGAPAR